MNRQEIVRFYENKIDDVKDENKREELYKELTDIENMMISLDGEIDKELKEQETEYIDEYALANEFNHSCRMPA